MLGGRPWFVGLAEGPHGQPGRHGSHTGEAAEKTALFDEPASGSKGDAKPLFAAVVQGKPAGGAQKEQKASEKKEKEEKKEPKAQQKKEQQKGEAQQQESRAAAPPCLGVHRRTSQGRAPNRKTCGTGQGSGSARRFATVVR